MALCFLGLLIIMIMGTVVWLGQIKCRSARDSTNVSMCVVVVAVVVVVCLLRVIRI